MDVLEYAWVFRNPNTSHARAPERQIELQIMMFPDGVAEAFREQRFRVRLRALYPTVAH